MTLVDFIEAVERFIIFIGLKEQGCPQERYRKPGIGEKSLGTGKIIFSLL